MEGENGKKQSPIEQQSPQSGEGSTEINPSPTHEQRQPYPHHHSRGQRGARGMLHPPPAAAAYNLNAIPVDTFGGGGGSTLEASSSSSICGFANSRKRARKVAAGDHHDHRNYKVQYPFSCSTSGKGFLTAHRDRVWKGALPPPLFSREEFADTGSLNPVKGEDDDSDDEEDQEVDQPLIAHKEETAPSPAPPRHYCVLLDFNKSPPTEDDDCVVPDLNKSPPTEDNDDSDDEEDQEVDQPLIAHKEETAPSPAPPRHYCVLPDFNKSPPTEDDDCVLPDFNKSPPTEDDDDDDWWE